MGGVVKILRGSASLAGSIFNTAGPFGAEGLLDLGSEKPLALLQNGVAPVQNKFRKVHETLGRSLLPGSRRPFSRNHFRDFPIFEPLPDSLVCKP